MPSCIDSYNMSSDGFTQHFVMNLGHLYEMRENEGDSTVYCMCLMHVTCTWL